MGTPYKYRQEFCEQVVEILAQGKSLAAVCAHLDVSRQALYDWRDAHPEFNNALQRGIQKCQAYWEEIGKDGIVGNLDKFSATPWIFTMKNRFRDDYKEDKEPSRDASVIEKLLLGKLVE